MAISTQVVEASTPGRVACALVLFFVGSFIVDFLRRPSYPSSIPRMGHTGPAATLKNLVAYWTSYRKWVLEGNEKYSKNDRCFIVPSAASRASDIVLPRSQTTWMLEQPDRILSTHEAHDAILYSQYNFLGKRLAMVMQHARVIHKYLARHLTALIPGVQTAVELSMDDTFGKDTQEWKTLKIWDAWMSIVPRITNVILVGPDLAENKEFVQAMVKFTECVVFNGLILSAFPKITHPIMARLFTIPNWWHWRKSAKLSLPIIKQRLHDIKAKDAGDPAYQNWTEPADFISWSIHLALSEGDLIEADPILISKRLLPIEFAALHTTVLTGHSVFIDLVHSDPSRGFLDGIREEAARVLAEEGGRWTKNGLSRLYRIDSAIRESQRYSNFATTLVERKVVAPEGITNKTEGWHVPYGSMLTLNMQGVHHDENTYEKPDEYDAFRYSRPREEYEARSPEQKSAEESLRFKKMGMVTTSESHLAFGHGRHACPGRFFVAHELKMVVAYLVLNYDIQHDPNPRPKPLWFGQNTIPPLEASMQVKRREKPYSVEDFSTYRADL